MATLRELGVYPRPATVRDSETLEMFPVQPAVAQAAAGRPAVPARPAEDAGLPESRLPSNPDPAAQPAVSLDPALHSIVQELMGDIETGQVAQRMLDALLPRIVRTYGIGEEDRIDLRTGRIERGQ